jgi:hypothetical protein
MGSCTILVGEQVRRQLGREDLPSVTYAQSDIFGARGAGHDLKQR